jgi:cystathionine beta-lyase/cystathionine gamma-synthase
LHIAKHGVGLLRLSVGIEDIEEIIADIGNTLSD